MARVHGVHAAINAPTADRIALLDETILTALTLALREDRADVAEPLLQALEMLDRRPRPGSALARAYAEIIGRRKRGVRRQLAH